MTTATMLAERYHGPIDFRVNPPTAVRSRDKLFADVYYRQLSSHDA